MTRDEVIKLLTAYAFVASCRDELTRRAYAAGMTKMAIHRITGISRTTIDTILKDAPRIMRRPCGVGWPDVPA